MLLRSESNGFVSWALCKPAVFVFQHRKGLADHRVFLLDSKGSHGHIIVEDMCKCLLKRFHIRRDYTYNGTTLTVHLTCKTELVEVIWDYIQL